MDPETIMSQVEYNKVDAGLLTFLRAGIFTIEKFEAEFMPIQKFEFICEELLGQNN
jgi:hypothetical protein